MWASVAQSDEHGPSRATRAMIEARIIPMLALAGREEESLWLERSSPGAADGARGVDLDRWADLASAGSLHALRTSAQQLHREGWSETAVLLDVVAPVARLVGKDWAEDRRSWLEVTIAVSTLQQLVCALGRERPAPPSSRGAVLLFAAPGEQHTLSIHVLGEVLRHAGWSAHVEAALSVEEVVEIVAREPFVMVGMTVSSEDRMVWTADDVARVQAASARQGLLFMIGGAVDIFGYAARIRATPCSDARAAMSMLEGSVFSAPDL
jgi:methanogenic corrinoid protein MtbC1